MIKKILYVANVRMPTEKAHGFQIMKTLEAFTERGAEVEIIVPFRFNPLKQDPFEYYGLRRRFEIKRIPSLDLVRFGQLGFLIQYFSFLALALFYSLLRRVDAVYSRELLFCFFLSFLKKNVVFEDHEPWKSKRNLYALFLRRIKKKVVVPYGLAELYKKLGVDEASYIVVPNGVDLKEFEKVEPDRNIWQKDFSIRLGSKIALYVGHFYKWKGVFTLIAGAKYLKEDLKIVLIGGTEGDRKKTKDFIERNSIKNVFMRGFVPHKEAVQYIKSADILVLPNTAKEERSLKYTTPIKLFEYMASGVPMVASRLESFSYYLEDGSNAVFFEPDNPRNLAEKINYLSNNRNLAEKLAQTAYSQVKDYTWENRAEKILNFIKT